MDGGWMVPCCTEKSAFSRSQSPNPGLFENYNLSQIHTLSHFGGYSILSGLQGLAINPVILPELHL